MNRLMNAVALVLITLIGLQADLLAQQPAEQGTAEQGTAEPDTRSVLLAAIQASHAQTESTAAEREARFQQEHDAASQALAAAEKQLADLNAETDRLEARFTENELELEKHADLLRQRSASFGDLYAALRDEAGELASLLQDSPVSVQLADGRVARVAAVADEESVPSAADVRLLWQELEREIREAGRVVRFETDIVQPDGRTVRAPVTRIGVFTLTSDDDFLIYQPAGQQFTVLPRQPASRFTDLAGGQSTPEAVYDRRVIDPSRGAILSVVIQAPDIAERIGQAGLVGVIIIGLAALGWLIVLERLIRVNLTARAISRQRNDPTVRSDNPLGRVLARGIAHEKDGETAIERALEEEIHSEEARLTRGLALVKVIVSAAPLLGLLGTVTGMIGTFEAMSLFGTGDPQLMAGGISQALMTTALGLISAIPLLLMHSLVKSQSDAVMEIVSQQATGLLLSRLQPQER